MKRKILIIFILLLSFAWIPARAKEQMADAYIMEEARTEIYYFAGGGTVEAPFKTVDAGYSYYDGATKKTYKDLIATDQSTHVTTGRNVGIQLQMMDGQKFKITRPGYRLVPGKEWKGTNLTTGKTWYYSPAPIHNIEDIIINLGVGKQNPAQIYLIANWEPTGSVQSISIKASKKDISIDEKLNLSIAYTPSGAKQETITWTTSNKAIATVNSKGVVTGVKGGKVTITAKASGGAKSKIEITVYPEKCYYPDNPFESSSSAVRKQYLEALKETARDYIERGEAIQYDGSAITFVGALSNYGSNRGPYYFGPEEATMQYQNYTVCSTFVLQLFHSTFQNYVINGSKNSFASYINTHSGTPRIAQIPKPGSPYENKDIAVLYVGRDEKIDANGKKYYEYIYYNKEKGNTSTYYNKYHNKKDKPTTINNKYNAEKANSLRDDIMSVIQPGDVIVYTEEGTNTGHVVVYLGNNETAESYNTTSAGGVYNFQEKKDRFETKKTLNSTNYYSGDPVEGTIHSWYLNDCTNPPSNNKAVLGYNYRHLGYEVDSIAIFRPFNEIYNKGIQISDAAKSRLNYKDLYVEKQSYFVTQNNVVYKGRYGTIDRGRDITYSITLKNKGKKDYNNIIVTDVAPNGTAFHTTDERCVLENNNQKITCSNITVEAGVTRKIVYKLTVLPEYPGNYIEMKKTTVNNITLTDTVTYVGRTLNQSELKKIREASVDKNIDMTGSMAYIKDIYSKIGIKFDKGVAAVVKQFFTISGELKDGVNPSGDVYIFGNNNNTFNTGRIKFCDTNQKSGCLETMGNSKYLEKNVEYDVYWPKTSTNSSYAKMVIPGFYGGVLTLDYFNRNALKAGSTEKKVDTADFSRDFVARRRIRYVKESDFMEGDVLIINNSTLSTSTQQLRKLIAYIYIDGEFKTAVKKNGSYTVTSLSNPETVLEALIAEENFIVIRPAQSLAS